MPVRAHSPSVTVIGAGAAGLMAARFAASGGARVTVLETTKRGGKKIVISGGGRCNVLPSVLDERRFVTHSSRRLMGRLLRSWPLDDQRRFFEKELGLPLALEAETGKLFPISNRATDVREALIAAAEAAGARFTFRTRVSRIEPVGPRWRIHLDGAGSVESDAVILATGGLSVPNTGSDGFGLREAARLGHTIHATYPALTPLTAAQAPHASLSGISLTVRIRTRQGRRRVESHGGFLFTHRGYSGPAVLDVSHLATLAREAGADQQLLVQWTDLEHDGWQRILQAPGPGLVATELRQRLPARLADALLAEAGIPADRSRGELRREERGRLIEVLTAYPLPWTGDEGYRKAEVTGGGVALEEVDPATLESRRAPGLFLCGEVLDAFGPIGGYNFLWAWATGRLAGEGAARTHGGASGE
jgi:predicted Rossmann fold flavoprotein